MLKPQPSAPVNHRRWLGFVGSVVLAIGAVGAGVLPVPDPFGDLAVLRAARTETGTTICILVAALGMAALVSAWWQLRDLELTPRWVVVTAAIWSVPLLLAPPLFSRDVYSYAAVGDLLVHGLDPYTVGPGALRNSSWLDSVSTTWRDTPAPYGPLYLRLGHLAVAMSGHVLPVAILLLRLISVAGVALTAAYLPRLARACGVDPSRALWLAVASPLVLAHYVSGVHNDAVMVGLIVASLAYAAERQGPAAAIAIGLAATVKAPALIALPFVALLWSGAFTGRSAVVRAGAATVGIAAAAFTTVTVATGLGFGWVKAAAETPGLTIQWTSIPTGFGLGIRMLAGEFGGAPGPNDPRIAVPRTIGTVVLLVILVALFVRAWRHRSDVRLVTASVGWAMLAAVLLAAAFHPWYLPWALVPLAASVVDRRVVTALAAASAGLCFLVRPDGFSFARVTVVPGVLLDVIGTTVLVVLGIRWLLAARATKAERTPVPTR